MKVSGCDVMGKYSITRNLIGLLKTILNKSYILTHVAVKSARVYLVFVPAPPVMHLLNP